MLQSVVIGLSAAAVALGLWACGALDRFEFSTWAWRVGAFASRSQPSPDVKIILLDQASLDWGSREMGWSWPWPREVYAAALDFCRRGGARVVGVDVLFTEPSVYGEADDAALGEAMRQAGHVAAAAFHGRERVTLPVAAVATNAAVLGNVADEPDEDGVFRRATLWRDSGTGRIPSLGLATWLLATARTPEGAGAAEDWPLDARGRLLLRFSGKTGFHETYSAAAVVQSELRLRSGEPPVISPSVFSNACVLVGFGAPGLMDLRPTPVSRVAPGVEVQAAVLDNLLSGRLMRDAPAWMSLLLVALLAVLAAGMALCARRAAQGVAAFAVALPLPAAVGFVAYDGGYWWPLVPGSLAVVLALTAAVLVNYATEGRQKAFIKRAFRHYLGTTVIDQILADPSRLKLGGEKRELTVFFSDIEGFSTFSERLSPEALTALLNDYLSDMSAIIREEGGYLDKYIGDAIVAFWNAPVTQPDHAARACRAAVRCQRRLDERREAYRQQTGVTLRARIGINTGEAVVGNMGSYERFNYTVLGDAANLASRLEGANKAFGTYVMVSESTWRQAEGSVLGRELARLRVVGREQPVRVYELNGLAGEPAPAAWDAFEEGVRLFGAGRFEDAQSRFEACPDDPAARAYAAKCSALKAHAPEGWSGVWTLDAK